MTKQQNLRKRLRVSEDDAIYSVKTKEDRDERDCTDVGFSAACGVPLTLISNRSSACSTHVSYNVRL